MHLPVKLIEDELKTFEIKFKEAVGSHVPMLDRIMRYVVKRKGKQLRPMFVFLSAKLCGEVNESTYRAASLVELLHTATLVHDDVVDDSLEHRGFFSVGDYLLAKGLLLSLDHNDHRILHIVSDAVRKMSEGELLQIEKARSLNLNEKIYFDIIRNKTASLLASGCAAGAWSTSNNNEVTEKVRLFGEKVGIAFQIKDDLFDYGTDSVGKPTGNDIKEKKLTLPLIYTLNNIDKPTRRQIIYIIKNQNKNPEKIKFVINKVTEAGGIEYAVQKMNDYKSEAMKILFEFPQSEIRSGLAELVDFVTDRKY